MNAKGFHHTIRSHDTYKWAISLGLLVLCAAGRIPPPPPVSVCRAHLFLERDEHIRISAALRKGGGGGGGGAWSQGARTGWRP